MGRLRLLRFPEPPIKPMKGKMKTLFSVIAVLTWLAASMAEAATNVYSVGVQNVGVIDAWNGGDGPSGDYLWFSSQTAAENYWGDSTGWWDSAGWYFYDPGLSETSFIGSSASVPVVDTSGRVWVGNEAGANLARYYGSDFDLEALSATSLTNLATWGTEFRIGSTGSLESAPAPEPTLGEETNGIAGIGGTMFNAASIIGIAGLVIRIGVRFAKKGVRAT